MKISDLQDVQFAGGEEVANPSSAETTQQPYSGFSVGQTIKNIPSSAGKFAGGLASAALHPIQTAKAVGSVAVGGVEKLIPGQQAEEKSFDLLVDFYKQRYGSVDQFLKTLQEDPVGVAADASTVFTGGGAAIGTIGKLSNISKVSKAGNTFTAIGSKTNPLSVITGLSPVAKNSFAGASRLLEKWSLRLTPTQKSELGTKVNTLADYISRQGIVGSPEARFAKATNLYNAMEDSLDTFFSQMSKGSTVDKASIIRGLQGLKGVYKNDRDSLVINKQIDGMINTIKKNQGDRIPFINLNKLKRSTFQNAYNKAGSKVIDDVEHSMGDILNDQMKEGLKGLKINNQSFDDFNQNYGQLIEARKLLKLAMGRNELSPWSERILGGLLGSVAGGPMTGGVGALIGPAMFENAPVTFARSAISSGLRKASETKLPAGASKIKAPLTATERITESQKQGY